jgi:hypothetical protein
MCKERLQAWWVPGAGAKVLAAGKQEMGEEAGEGDEVVDEKLWGEDEERPNDPNAKTEKDAPVKVRPLNRLLLQRRSS